MPSSELGWGPLKLGMALDILDVDAPPVKSFMAKYGVVMLMCATSVHPGQPMAEQDEMRFGKRNQRAKLEETCV